MVAADADGNKASPLVALLAGGIAGGVEAACTYPFEFAKTRVQLYGHEGLRNPFAVVARVARQEGLGALYKGCSTMIVVCRWTFSLSSGVPCRSFSPLFSCFLVRTGGEHSVSYLI